MVPVLELYRHASRSWLTDALLERFRAALQSLLSELLDAPPGPDHVLSGLPVVEVSIVDDDAIARVHEQFLGIPGATDVITFPYGEILVSCDTASQYAGAHGLNQEEELFRYMVHGLVHLQGYLDAEPEERAALFSVQEPLVTRFFPR